MTKCQLCKQNEAEWAMQFVAEDTPSFSALGSHYRGFTVEKVCDHCRNLASGKFYNEIAAMIVAGGFKKEPA